MNRFNGNRISPPAGGPGNKARWPRMLMAVVVIVSLSLGALFTGVPGQGYAQSGAPQSDEFNATSFTAPFHVVCPVNATRPCPDSQGSSTWSLDAANSGQLRIWTRPGTLLAGSATTLNNARNLVLQSFASNIDWIATTRMTFPGNTSTPKHVGQTAGLIVYGNADNFVFLGRILTPGAAPRIEFIHEAGGHPVTTSVQETQTTPSTVYLRLTKAGNLYQAAFSYDNRSFVTILPGSSSTHGYTATYTSPRVGLVAFGGTASTAAASAVRADFDWFHVTVTTPTPTLAISHSSATPGSSDKVSGTGFRAGETVTVRAVFPLYNGNSLTVTRTAVVAGNGTFGPVAFTIPQGAKVDHVTITATGNTSTRTAHTALSVVYHPRLSTTTPTVPPGGTVTAVGNGFVANSKVSVSITIRNPNGTTTTRATTVTANGTGGFRTSLSLPGGVQSGTYTITAVDTAGTIAAAGTIRATAHVTVSLRPSISLSTATVLPGHALTVHGAGFSAGAQVTVRAVFPLYGGGSKTVATTATTSSTGTFTAHLTVPAQAASGPVSVTAQGPNGRAQTRLSIRPIQAAVSLSPAVVIPGSTTVIRGSGYLPGSKVDITVPVTLVSGASSTLTATATANSQGAFSAQLRVPANVRGGTYSVHARGEASGRTPTTRLVVSRLAPSLVAVPTTAVPGTQITATGFGFASGATVKVTLQGQTLGTATANAAGQFTVKVTIPTSMASGSYTLTAVSNGGRHASANLAVNRRVSTHFYFAALYTGHQEYLALLNPSAIRARVTITYQLTTGTVRSKVVQIGPHTRYTENVNADLGPRVSSAAVVAADVPIAAERVAYRGTDGVVVPGRPAPSTSWYFANGNTSHGYSEYVAIQNPNSSPVQVAVHVLPTHHSAFTQYRTLQPTSRVTLHMNRFVKDAIGVTVTASAPVVANYTIRIHHGITSKIGVTGPQRSWYFAGGPQSSQARHWIAVLNPSGNSVYLTLHAYAPSGVEVGTVKQWLKPNARAGYLMNRVAHRTDVAVVVQASSPIVAEQTTYAGGNHDASTDTFGTSAPAKAWAFAASNTLSAGGQSDYLDLFNPNLTVIPVAVQFMDTSGKVIQRTYLVGPLSHQRIDVGSVAPNSQLGIVAASSAPFVALNRYSFNNGLGGDTSAGIQTAG